MREKEVFVETGEPGTGVSGAVDSAGVVVDSVPSGCSEGVGTDVLGCGDDSSDGKKTGGSGVGEGGGVGILRASLITSGGGRAREEMMMPGAVDGSEGRFDQMTQPPSLGS
jgi:hypothetical protein